MTDQQKTNQNHEMYETFWEQSVIKPNDNPYSMLFKIKKGIAYIEYENKEINFSTEISSKTVAEQFFNEIVMKG